MAPTRKASNAAPKKKPASPKRPTRAATDADAEPVAIDTTAFERAAGGAATPDIDEAARAFEALAPTLEALDDRTLLRVTVDAQQAALVALSADARLVDAKRAAAIQSLAKLSLVRAGDVAGLRDAALATWYARHKLLEAAGTATSAALPTALRDQAKACRGRMRATLEYNVPKNESKGWSLLRLYRAGRGDVDLANDLDGYANMYVAPYVDYIASDKTNYRANDRALAKDLAAKIRGGLSSAETPEIRRWAASQQRALTLLKGRYDETARAGRFIERDDDREVYPTLFGGSRAAPSHKPADEVPAPPPLAPTVTA